MNDTATNPVERFVIAPSYDLPELATIREVDWVDRRDPISVATTYFDTSDRQLARRGLTLFQEYGGGCDSWILSCDALHRRLRVASGGDETQPALESALRGLLGGKGLVAKVALTTVRETSVAFDDDGQALAEISIDHVSARLRAGMQQRAWDALAVNFLGCDQDRVADQVRRKLVERGALPSERMGRTCQLLEVSIPERPRRLAGLVHDFVIPQLDRLIVNDVALRSGADAAHETRQAARRLLSVVRVMPDVFQADAARHLTTELSWFAGVLGSVTDCDAQRKRLRHALTSASVAAGHLAGRPVVMQELVIDREHALSALHRAMCRDRYLALLDLLADWRSATPHAPKATATKKRSVRRYLERAEVELEWRLAAVHDAPSEQGMHAARQAARRTRHVAELAQPALGKPADRARNQAMAIQEQLGEHRDAVIAAELSRRLGVALDGAARDLLVSLSSQLDHEVDLARQRSLRVLTSN